LQGNPLKKLFNVIYRSEANDLAIQLARLYTGGYDVVSVERAFHGGLSITNNVSPKQFINGGNNCLNYEKQFILMFNSLLQYRFALVLQKNVLIGSMF